MLGNGCAEIPSASWAAPLRYIFLRNTWYGIAAGLRLECGESPEV